MEESPEITYPPRAPKGTLDKKGEMTAWPFSGLWRVSRSTLFQMTLVAALLATVLGDCGPPPNLNFAFSMKELNETSYKEKTLLTYNCRPGFIRSKTRNYITCEKGRWQYDDFCIRRKCSNPGELRNGEVTLKPDFSFGSHIEFNCLEGYVLIGSPVSYCEVQDRNVGWSHRFPECVIAQCEAPPSISNGRHNAGYEDLYQYGSSVTYSCNPRFSMVGDASISCTVENKTKGVWRPSPPTCKRVICPQPHVKDGRITIGFGHTYTYKDSVTFECNKGFVLKGSDSTHCGADNNWDPPPPTCEIYSCTNLSDVPHASWEKYNYRPPTKDQLYEVGTVLRYHCHPGYKTTGNKPMTVTCQRNLEWTPYAECEEVCCPVPELMHGKITSQRQQRKGLTNKCEYFYGDSISYSCDEKRKSEASCQGDGTWSPETPTCGESCYYPPVIDHGHPKLTKHLVVSNKAKYECDKGYLLVGNPELSCSFSRWSGPPPQCKALCPTPEIEHGNLLVDKDQFLESENVTIQCDSGYAVVGPQNITCSEDRTWYPEVPTCEWVSKNAKPSVAPLRLSTMSPKSTLPALYLYGVLILLLCPSGLCDCRTPPRIAHGSHRDISSFLSFTTVLHYECDEGYVLVGDPQVTCRSSQWSSPAPRCKALCLKPEVENGNLSEDKDLFIESENLTIQCDSGYGVVNSQNITCSGNRTWYPEVPKCEWEVHNGCEQVVEGSKLMQCLPNPMDVKVALEVYKLSLEIKRLKEE